MTLGVQGADALDILDYQMGCLGAQLSWGVGVDILGYMGVLRALILQFWGPYELWYFWVHRVSWGRPRDLGVHIPGDRSFCPGTAPPADVSLTFLAPLSPFRRPHMLPGSRLQESPGIG